MISHFFATNAGIVLVYMTLWWVVATAKKNNAIVDIAWGTGFVIIALYGFTTSFMLMRNLIITVMVLLWGVRLSAHILQRSIGKPEDFRYAQMRKKWGSQWMIRGYLNIFLLQGIIMLLVALPIMVTHFYNIEGTVGLSDRYGILIWLTGLIIESSADFQMYLFKKDPGNKGKINTSGLWKYSRHPNYFGEILVWWGIFLVASNVQYGYLTIVSPILMTFLLTRVSGVPMLEKKYAGNASYAKYVSSTNAIIPWFPKK